ncbi:MAG TPA: heparinase II/III family protein [Alphaproteobacteria bacterium]|jgi:uncharacterized heparinase superfamily protein
MAGERSSGAPKQAASRVRSPLAFPLFRAGAEARQLLFTPPDPWPGNAAAGHRLLAATEPLAWDAANGDIELEAHGFAWLRDLRAVGGDAARQRCQNLIRGWIARHGERPERPLWTPALMAERLVNWIGQFDFFGKAAPQSFKAPFFRSMARQALALARMAPRLAPTAERVHALRALIAFGAAVPGAHARLDLALRFLLPMLEAWPAHGVVPERNPSDQLAVLRDLVNIRAFLVAAHHELPDALDAAIARAGRALAALRHADGGLALFHGGAEEEATLIDVVLALAGAEAAAPSRFSGGFERAAAGDALLLFDAAPPPGQRHDRAAHAGMLAFEFSVGRARLIVNCGAYHGREARWRDAGRMTAAHSTLVIGDRNSAEVRHGGGLRHRPLEVAADRQEEDGAVWIAGSHGGYLRRFGVLHRRRLFLAPEGADLRGEDRLAPEAGKRIPRKTLGTPFAIRFHLHPDIVVGAAERDGDGASAVPFASAESGPWHLVAESRLAASVEDSLYLGRGGPPKKTKQIVLSGRIDNDTAVEARWAIRRIR